jgi:phosphatidylglycerophosphate synthase
MDGKLAKLRGAAHPLGGWFDVIGDSVRLTACSIGLMVALHDESRLAAPILMAYVSLRFGVLMVAEARRLPPRLATIAVRAGPLAVLGAAPRRSAPPGTTVDGEALVFTLGPLAGVPVVAAALGAALELAHLLVYVVQAVRAARDRAHG